MMMKAIAAVAGLLISLPLAAHTSQADVYDAHARSRFKPKSRTVDLKPLAARYEVQVGQGIKTDWYLWRDADKVETANAALQRNEIWERAPGQGVHYRRFFHAQRKYLEYTPGELKTQRSEPEWRQIVSIIDPEILAKLKRQKAKPVLGRKTTRYLGRYGGEVLDVVWLEREALPARLIKRSPQGSLTMTLKEVHAQAPARWPRVQDTMAADYVRIDGADLGDMESDPFVARLQAEAGHTHAH